MPADKDHAEGTGHGGSKSRFFAAFQMHVTAYIFYLQDCCHEHQRHGHHRSGEWDILPVPRVRQKPQIPIEKIERKLKGRA